MSRRIAVSMRVVVSEYGERRDALAQDWAKFLRLALPECLWVPLPNLEAQAVELAEKLDLNALILTGGDDWGRCPERDQTEIGLFTWAKSNGYPIGGVCRGMQVINFLLGGELTPLQAHVAVRHTIRFSGGATTEVNSFHSNGVSYADLAPSLAAAAVCDSEWIEAFTHIRLPIFGVMWHPEREHFIAEHDRLMFKNFFAE